MALRKDFSQIDGGEHANVYRYADPNTNFHHKIHATRFTPTNTPTLTLTPTLTPTATLGAPQSITIDYTYDPLYRLSSAVYSGTLTTTIGYSYDAVGNRLTQDMDGVVTNYGYDNANRLTSVNGVAYTWDNNGNLLSDGVNTYQYDQVNRLISVNGQTTFAYNGLGDRLRQTVGGVPTTYVNDYAAGLTQVLADGTNMYLYGAGRIAQQPTNQPTNFQYFGVDGLGSVRQLYDASGTAIANKHYDPYGNVLSATGAGSVYGFTGGTDRCDHQQPRCAQHSVICPGVEFCSVIFHAAASASTNSAAFVNSAIGMYSLLV